MGGLHHVLEFILVHASFHHLAHGRGNLHQTNFLALPEAVGHIASRDNDCRNIQTGASHQMARDNGVTGRKQHHTIKHIGFHIQLHLITDEVAAGKFDVTGILEHHSVAKAGGNHFKGQAARIADTLLHTFSHLTEMHMAGIVFIPRIHHGDVGALFHFFLRIAQTVENAIALDAGYAEIPFAPLIHDCFLLLCLCVLFFQFDECLNKFFLFVIRHFGEGRGHMAFAQTPVGHAGL